MENNSAPFYKVDLSRNSLVILDTSFVLDFAGHNGNETKQTQCEDFIWSIMMANAVFAITAITERELYEVLLKNEYKRYFTDEFTEKDLKKLRVQDPAKLNSMIQNAEGRKNNVIKLLNASSAFYNETVGEDYPLLFQEAVQIQRQCALPGLSDAFQIAISKKCSGDVFATTDSDFNRVKMDNLTIAVDEKTYKNHYE